MCLSKRGEHYSKEDNLIKLKKTLLGINKEYEKIRKERQH